jgi:Lrp/AsnC family transcriptional regulator, leucine-responsive regulatory protein
LPINIASTLDSVDRALLNKLQLDTRLSNLELAELVHLSPSACLRRVRRLEEEGFIDRYVALINRRLIGRATDVFVEISLSSQREDLLDEFEKAIATHPEIVSCHLMSGDSDYLVRVAVADVAGYEKVHREVLAQLPHVARLKSSFALRTICERTAHQLPQ